MSCISIEHWKYPEPGHAPMWAVEVFDRLRVANGGKLDGFFDVFAWRDPDEVRFDEANAFKHQP